MTTTGHSRDLRDDMQEHEIGRRLLGRYPRIWVGAGIVLIAVLVALLASWIAPADPLSQALSDRLLPPLSQGEEGQFYVLGSDRLGRDMLSRVIYGARVSLLVGLGSVLLALVGGVPFGLLSGFRRGLAEQLVMGVVEVLTTFPYILLALAMIAILGPSIGNLIIVLSIRGWPFFARIAHVQAVSLSALPFVEAARALGASKVRIVFDHLARNVLPLVIVLATVEVARVILIEASLSFLGLGVPIEIPTWGGMLSDARDYLERAWWLAIFPGMAIVVTALGINLLGDGLRQKMDPSGKWR